MTTTTNTTVHQESQEGKLSTFVPVTDIFETSEQIIVIAEVPGSDADSVDITLDRNVLRFHAKNKTNQPSQQYSLIHKEYRVGHYEQSLTLNTDVDHERIQATIKNGILKITLPKTVPQTKTITVQTA